jgi:FtsP/CotA-like multicopper oxidase with cupredoxin domain
MLSSHHRPLPGLAALISLTACGPGGSAPPPATHTYYIAADEVDWDYAPGGDTNRITGEPYDSVALFFVGRSPTRIGRVYRKAVYREYADSTFTTLKPRPAEWEHLGILGPLLRAVVGDTIRVVFRNRAAFPASVHPHGVFYAKNSEGAPYAAYRRGARTSTSGRSRSGRDPDPGTAARSCGCTTPT